MLVAFRDNDPNGNGQKDEIPYCVVGKDYPHRMFYDLLGSWGFGINGVMDSDYAFSWLDIDDAGNVRFIGREDKFKNMVEFYNKLWTEGLVDKESYSQDQTQAAAKVNAGYLLSLAISILLALLVGAGIMALSGHDPIGGYGALITGALSS